MKKSKIVTQFHFPLKITHFPTLFLQLNTQNSTYQPRNYILLFLIITLVHDNTIVFIRIWNDNGL